VISITVKLFASLRERLAHQDFIWEMGSDKTISEATVSLSESKGSHWLDILNEKKIIVAVNQNIVDRSYLLQDGDELAFFPPVTGG